MGIQKIGPNEFLIKARVIIPSPDPRKNRQDRRRREPFKGTKAQAEERLLEIKRELRGERPTFAASTFGQLLEAYRNYRGGLPGGQRSTFNTLHRDLGLVPVAPLERLQAALAGYFDIVRTLRNQVNGEPLAHGSINRLRTMALAALNLAKERGVIPRNPLTKAVWPKLKEIPRDRMLTAEEDMRLRAVLAAEAPHLWPLYQFASLVPCRRSELTRMTRNDLDLFNNAIRVYNGTTKNDQGTWKPIPESMLGYFRSLPAGCTFLFWRPGKGRQAGQFLPLGDFKKAWSRCLRLAGIRDFHFHDTRHASATAMVNAGTPERVVMKVAGWKTNMLSTYWGSSGQEHLQHVRFPAGSGTNVALTEQDGAKSAESGAERAVS